MNEYITYNILDVICDIGEDACKSILSSFCCPLNKEVEKFIKTNAISFSRQHITITYLIFCDYQNKSYLVGYFSLANKFVLINEDSLDNATRKKVIKFSQYDEDLDRRMLSMPLIAQLGKNFAPLPIKVNGKDLLRSALKQVEEIEHLIGGKTVFIECSNQKKLYGFYSSEGFLPFGERICKSGEVLVQMLKVLKHK